MIAWVFGSFSLGFYTLFMVILGRWPDDIEVLRAFDEYGRPNFTSIAFIYSYYLTVVITMLNLVVAVLLDNFFRISEEIRRQVFNMYVHDHVTFGIARTFAWRYESGTSMALCWLDGLRLCALDGLPPSKFTGQRPNHARSFSCDHHEYIAAAFPVAVSVVRKKWIRTKPRTHTDKRVHTSCTRPRMRTCRSVSGKSSK